MAENRTIPFHDSLYRLAQVGASLGVQLVRLTSLKCLNVYRAMGVEFAGNGTTSPAGSAEFEVTNLAEPADQAGQLPAGSEAVALDVEGRWVIFVRLGGGAGAVLARVVSASGSGAYVVREQTCDAAGGFIDKPGTANFTATNLAELSLGPGAAVDVGTRVLVTTLSGASTRCVFDHPAYAKYLD